jgi:uncharacterized protein YjiK
MRKYLYIAAIAVLLLCSCHSATTPAAQQPNSTSAKDTIQANTFTYSFSKPAKKWTLPPELTEISGNAWIDKNHLMVIEDLHPNLYIVRLDNQAAIEKTIPFAATSKDKMDIEDIAVVNNTAYALWSHGKIFKISDWNTKPQTKEIKTFLSKENNTEGICYDPVSQQLLIACKNEADLSDEKKSTRAVYAYDRNTDSLLPQPLLVIRKKDLKAATGEKIDFYPSAIAVHPVTHDIYILSTRDTKCIARFSHDGIVQSVELLDKDLLPQPEGICFAPDGTLYISSEGKHGEPGQILQFDYAKK